MNVPYLVIYHPVAKLRVFVCRWMGDPDCFRSGNLADSIFPSTSLRPAPTRSLSALVSGGREGRRAEGGGGAEGRRAHGWEIGGGRGGESPRAGVGAGKPGANVDNRLEVSAGEPPSPPLQRPGRSGARGHRPGLLLPGGPKRRLLTPALRGRKAGDGPQGPASFSSDSFLEGSHQRGSLWSGEGMRGDCPTCWDWASRLEAGSLLCRGEGIWGCGVESEEVGESSLGVGGKRGRGSGEGACVGGCGVGRLARVSVFGSGGVWGAKLGLGQGWSKKVSVDTGRKGSCGKETC